MDNMRLIQNYFFKIGTKIPFSELPDIVHRFLEANNLTSHRFLYYFEDIHSSDEQVEDVISRCACAKILKDCPSLGKIRCQIGEYSNTLYLSNVDTCEYFDEAKILPLMNKIHRRYGFCECDLYYFDIDFFGFKTSFERNLNDDAEELIPYGSGIALHKDACAQNFLKLSVDIWHDGNVFDATPYFESMQNLLHGIKSSASLEVHFTEEEKLEFERINEAAKPVAEQCRSFFEQHFPFTSSQNNFSSNYSIAKPLKKLAKQYGYTYNLIRNGGLYSLEKRTSRGNVICIEADSGPSHYNSGIGVSYQGLGFKIDLGTANQTPTNQQEADAFFQNVMQIVSEFETTLLPSLDILYPETPDWFTPDL